MTELPRMVRLLSEAPWPDEEDELLRRRYEAGRTVYELARLHGREPDSIRQRLRKIAAGTSRH